jgi:RNA pseudouridylate synthase
VVFDKPAGISHHDHDEEVFFRKLRYDDDDQQNTRSTTTTLGILSLVALQYPHLVANDDASNDDDDDDMDEKNDCQQQGRRLYGVHRLDQVTSGLLIVAKTKNMARRLTQAFTERNVTKYYTALSLKAPSKKKQGWVKGYMKRGRRKSWYLVSSAVVAALSSGGSGPGQKNNNSDSTTGADACWAQTYFWTAGLGHLMDQYQPPLFLSSTK